MPPPTGERQDAGNHGPARTRRCRQPFPAIASARLDQQPNNPLHGVTLQAMLEYLIAQLGFERMARAVDIRCFTHEPSLTSSLKFLRKVPWARTKVEELYLRARRRHSS